MAAIATVVRLLPIILVEYQEVELIAELNKFFHFDHNIFLLDSSVDMNRFISRQEHKPRSVYVFKSDDDNITELECLTNIQSKNTLMVVVAEGATLDSNLNLLNRIKNIQRLQTKMKIGMFLPNCVSSEDLNALFAWCKLQLIVYIFAATYGYTNVIEGVTTKRLLNIFTFHPFGTFEVTNVTDAETFESYFLSLDSNFHQHQLRVRAPFRYPAEAYLWLTIFKLMNASFLQVPLVLRIGEIGSIMDQNKIDIIPVGYKIYPFDPFDNMYPLTSDVQVVIVPEAEPYSDFSAYLKTITSDEFFIYSLVTFAVIMLLLCVIRYIKQKKILFFQCIADVLNLLMNDNSYINYQQLSRVEVFIIVPLTFVGIVIVNGILSNLQSYLTRPILQPQIKTIEDIYKSPFAIHTYDEEWKYKLVDTLINLTTYNDWENKVIVLELEQYFEHLGMFNTSKSYLTSETNVQLLLEVQKHLNIKGFYNTQIQMFTYLEAHVVHKKFLFFERLDDVVQRLHSAGLYLQWHQAQYTGWKKQTEKEIIELSRNQNGSVVETFQFPMLIVYGWLLSFIVFVIEIIWKNIEL